MPARSVGTADVVSALELAVFEYLAGPTGRLHQGLEDVTAVEFDGLSDQQRNETIRPTMIKLKTT